MTSGLHGLQICEGYTGHFRHRPARNSFRYRLLCVRFDAVIAKDVDGLLHRALKAFSFRPEDYLIKASANLDQAARSLIAASTGFVAKQIILLTMPRLFGYAFNPVSFWFCKSQGKLEGVLCEVNNTFGERHFYWVLAKNGEWTAAAKQFHVSPFLPVAGYYRFRFDDGDERTRVDIEYYSQENELVLSTWMQVSHRPITEAHLPPLLAKYGWITVFVTLRIHWQAVRLWLKRIPFKKKPAPPHNKVTK